MNWIWWSVVAVGVLASLKARAAELGATPEAFVKGLREALMVVAPYLSEAAQQIVIAHAALESGWGRSTPARAGYNLFNVTRVRSDPGPVIESGDLEYDDSGSAHQITQRFAKYGSAGEGLAEYFGLLARKYGTALAELEAGDSAGFVAALRAGGYFTLPLGEYQSRFAGVLAGVRKRWG